MPRPKLTPCIVAVFITSVLAGPAIAQSAGQGGPSSSELFSAGYSYGKLFGYYNRSLGNFDTLTRAQKDNDRDIMIYLSVDLETHIKALVCPQGVLQAIQGIQSELSAREQPREFRLSQLDRAHQCLDNYSQDLRGYWWTGRSVGTISWLFENIDHPEIAMRPEASDKVILEHLYALSTNSILIYGTKGLPARAEQLLRELESIRKANAQKSQFDTATRALVKRHVTEIPEAFLPR